jgi:ABC-2 type transport system ATP-binding protein
MEPAVQVENLVKRFGSFTAVDGVTFSVERGEVFGILGPNGAGKTTTLEIIESLQKPTEGRVSVLGLDVQSDAAKVKTRIGVQLQASAYYDYLNLKEILALLGSFYPSKVSPESLLDQVGLSDKSASRMSELSGGQRQRFGVAASLVNNPELVVLDEPTTGLDPQARRNLWGLIREVNGRGVTVVLTTHYMEEAETLCSRLAIMDHGRILALDTPRNLINQLKASYAVKLTLDKPMTVAQLESLNGGVELVQSEEQSEEATDEAAKSENTYLLRLANSPTALRAMLDEIDKAGLGLENLQITPVTLEDVFLELTGSELRD